MPRVQRFTLLTAVLLVLGQLIAQLLDASTPNFPHFARFLLLFVVIKLSGDLVYFLLWPEQREWVFLHLYLLDDFFTYFRFAFPLSVIQRMIEIGLYPPRVHDAPPAGLLHQIIAGPLIATAMYLVNRWLREEARENSYQQARNFLHLP
ncbi:MAG: hypothetical protein R6U70_09360 [Bacillota bacterium]